MRRPPSAPTLGALFATALLAAALAAQEPPAADEAAAERWYRVELLVLRHRGAAAASAERWPAYPSLAYPADARFLIDRARSDDRLARYAPARSRIDDRGVQTLQLTAPPPLRAPGSRALDEAAFAAVPLEPTRPDGHVGPAAGTPAPAGSRPPAPPAFVRLGERALPAARLARGDYEVLWHAAWLQPVPPEEAAVPLLLDRSGDLRDAADWPRLQGSVRLYLSRYLHLEANLWLNTDGGYLPPGWRGDVPPRGPPSLRLRTPPGWALREGARGPLLLPALPRLRPRPGEVPFFDLDLAAVTEPAAAPVDWPWRHAVALKAARRMRSDETHYIDHPLLGVVVRLEPLEEEALAAWGARLADPAWARRHGRADDNARRPTQAPPAAAP